MLFIFAHQTILMDHHLTKLAKEVGKRVHLYEISL